jgi:hypothetical protein
MFLILRHQARLLIYLVTFEYVGIIASNIKCYLVINFILCISVEFLSHQCVFLIANEHTSCVLYLIWFN